MDDQRSHISASTRVCAVYGHPIKHSASPAMQNAGLAALGLDWRYLAFDVHPDHLRDAIHGAKAMRFLGLNLTVPHKLMALRLVDWIDPIAQKWGAINTIRFEAQAASGEWRPLSELPMDTEEPVRAAGFNTDADAIIRSISEDLGLRLQGATVLLLGAGGAGRVAALKLAEAGVRELYLQNRTLSKAEALAGEITAAFPATRCLPGYPGGAVDLVLNATSLGLRDTDPLPFAPAEFYLAQARHAYDMIYQPSETLFLRQARAAGCATANGMGMLLYQGARALELWSGKEAPIEAMRQALRARLYPAGAPVLNKEAETHV
jgi:shikimate dehydrogenase